jgi:hypothetical protein
LLLLLLLLLLLAPQRARHARAWCRRLRAGGLRAVRKPRRSCRMHTRAPHGGHTDALPARQLLLLIRQVLLLLQQLSQQQLLLLVLLGGRLLLQLPLLRQRGQQAVRQPLDAARQHLEGVCSATAWLRGSVAATRGSARAVCSARAAASTGGVAGGCCSQRGARQHMPCHWRLRGAVAA